MRRAGRSSSAAGSSGVDQVAKEVADLRLTVNQFVKKQPAARSASRVFGPDWTCGACGIEGNFERRSACRECGVGRGAGKGVKGGIGKGKGKAMAQTGGSKGNGKGNVAPWARESSIPPAVARDAMEVEEDGQGNLEDMEAQLSAMKETERWLRSQGSNWHLQEAASVAVKVTNLQETIKRAKPIATQMQSAWSNLEHLEKELEAAAKEETQFSILGVANVAPTSIDPTQFSILVVANFAPASIDPTQFSILGVANFAPTSIDPTQFSILGVANFAPTSVDKGFLCLVTSLPQSWEPQARARLGAAGSSHAHGQNGQSPGQLAPMYSPERAAHCAPHREGVEDAHWCGSAPGRALVASDGQELMFSAR